MNVSATQQLHKIISVYNKERYEQKKEVISKYRRERYRTMHKEDLSIKVSTGTFTFTLYFGLKKFCPYNISDTRTFRDHICKEIICKEM